MNDQQLYDRQIRAFGSEFNVILQNMCISISGDSMLINEIKKQLILLGVKELLCFQSMRQYNDLVSRTIVKYSDDVNLLGQQDYLITDNLLIIKQTISNQTQKILIFNNTFTFIKTQEDLNKFTEDQQSISEINQLLCANLFMFWFCEQLMSKQQNKNIRNSLCLKWDNKIAVK